MFGDWLLRLRCLGINDCGDDGFRYGCDYYEWGNMCRIKGYVRLVTCRRGDALLDRLIYLAFDLGFTFRGGFINEGDLVIT